MDNIRRYFKKAKNISRKQLMKKITNKIFERFYNTIRKQIIIRRPIDIDTNVFYEYEPNINFLFNIDGKKDYYKNKIKELGKEEEIIERANKICEHVFNLLGSADTYLGTDIQWNKDFKSGFVWRNKFYKDIKIVDLDNNADVKIPWELSRFQHVPTLGKAYILTNNSKYALEFMNQIMDWIKKNPIEMSVNWTCSMDVAIRACNWITGYYFFKDSPEIEQEFWNKLNKSLYLHGRFIMNNLENKGSITNNHYLSNVVGLVWLGLYFKGCKFKSRRIKDNPDVWFKFGLSELEKEMRVQVNEEGTDFEASTSYHCLVTEMLLYTLLFCSRNNIFFSKEYLRKLEAMIDYIMNVSKPNGLIPLIGDMDSGRFIILADYGFEEKRDFRHLLWVAGEYFNNNRFKYYGGDKKEEAIWCFKDISEPYVEKEELKSKAYSQSGFYILRNKQVHLVIRCGENSMRGHGGHSHNDQLSFELNVNGRDFIIDPGNYAYTSDYKMRNAFRSTKYHNTLQIGNKEQNDFNPRQVFELENETKAEMVEYKENYFKGMHFGYKNKLGVIHEREFLINEKSISIIDNLISNSNIQEEIYIRFHIPKDIELECNKEIIQLKKDNIRLLLKCSIDNYCIEDSFISKSYGTIEQSACIVFKAKNTNFIEVKIYYTD